MTEQRSLKRRVRARMEKTGERYTAARAHVVGGAAPAEPEPIADEDKPIADAALVRGSGRDWAAWLAILDGWGARERTHREIARHLTDEHGVPGWYAQSITVGYERARGMRDRHQNARGYVAGASRTVAVPAERLFAALVDPAERERWWPAAPLAQRTARPPRTARFDWEDGRTRVVVGFEDRGPKSTIAVSHERLADAREVERLKAMWRERLGELKAHLEG